MERKLIYVDNAATTKISKNCLNSMMPFLTDNYANPSSIYKMADEAKSALDAARVKAAKALNANPNEIFFTSCATESNNWAIKSYLNIAKKKGKNHIITSNIEHHSVLKTCENLEKEGFKVTYVPVDKTGLINPKDIEAKIEKTTALVSIMYVNNEIGTIQPIEEIATICESNNIIFHTDAVQAIGHIPIDLKNSKINMLSISGHKIHAPKGVGLLYVKRKTPIQSFLDGGGQERGLRAGTENLAFIVGFSKALEDAVQNIEEKEKRLKHIRDSILAGIKNKIDRFYVNGSLTRRIASNLNVSFEGIEGESLLLLLDAQNICASSGSACTSNSLDPSHVLLATGLPHEIAHSSLRISLSEENTEEEVDTIVDAIVNSVNRLRKISPIWN